MVPDKTLDKTVRRVLLVQLLCVALVVLGVGLYQFFFQTSVATRMNALYSAGFGSVLAVVGTLLAGRSVGRIRLLGENRVSVAPVFIGLLNRLIVIGGGIGFALVVLQLSPPYVVLSFLIVQFAQISVVNKDA